MNGIQFLGWDLSPDAMRSLLPFVDQAFAAEFLDEQVKIELQNLGNAIRAMLQHGATGRVW
jgi:hypothetical protein